MEVEDLHGLSLEKASILGKKSAEKRSEGLSFEHGGKGKSKKERDFQNLAKKKNTEEHTILPSIISPPLQLKTII